MRASHSDLVARSRVAVLREGSRSERQTARRVTHRCESGLNLMREP